MMKVYEAPGCAKAGRHVEGVPAGKLWGTREALLLVVGGYVALYAYAFGLWRVLCFLAATF